jgi:actin-related protein
MNSSVLSLFSTGRTRGLVVESGHGFTSTLPVFEVSMKYYNTINFRGMGYNMH